MPYHPLFTENACLRFKGGDCTSCVDVCPSKAISLVDTTRFIGDICLACGACAAVCPVDAVTHNAAEQLLKKITSLSPTATISVGCFAIPFAPEGMVQLDGCLSAIGLDILVTMALVDVETLRFVHGNCGKCTKGDQCRLFARTLDAFRLACPAVSEKIQCVEKKNSRQTSANTMSRRGLFNLFGSRKEAVSSQVRADESVLFQSQTAGSKRMRLHAAFHSLSCSEHVPEIVRIAEIEIAQSCTGCGTCSRVCPVNALEFVVDNNEFSIRFTTWKCVDCGLCVKSCLSESIHRHPATRESLTGSIPRTLYSGSLQKCKRCKAVSTTLTNGYCGICAHKLGV